MNPTRPSPRPTPRPRAATAALTLAALFTLVACGKAPAPRTVPPTSPGPTTPDRGPQGPAGLAADAPTATAGGVPLTGVPEALARAATALATRPDSATRDLIAAGPAASALAAALLGSLNLNELQGALTYFATHADGAPIARIAALLAHDAAAVRDAARRALNGHHGDALAQAVAPLATHDAPAVRIDALRVLAGVGGPLARAAVASGLEDADDLVVLEAGAALGRLGPPVEQTALDAVWGRADARPAQVRAALTAARRADGAVPTATADRALAGDDLLVAVEAARALSRVQPDDRTALLTRAWTDARLDVRRALLEGLMATADPASLARGESLAREALTDAAPALRVAAVAALSLRVPAPRPAPPATPPTPSGAAPSGATPTPSGPAPAPSGASAPVPTQAPAAPPFDEATWGPLPNLLAAALGDPAPVVRSAAAAALSSAVRDPQVMALLDARLDLEADPRTQQVLISALARIGTRAALARVIARLAQPALKSMAHLALMRVARQEIPADAALWQAWLDRRKPARGAPDDTLTGPDGVVEAADDDEAPAGTPPAAPSGAVVPDPDGTIPAHMSPDGRWIPRKPAPKPPGTPRTPRPTLTGVPG